MFLIFKRPEKKMFEIPRSYMQ